MKKEKRYKIAALGLLTVLLVLVVMQAMKLYDLYQWRGGTSVEGTVSGPGVEVTSAGRDAQVLETVMPFQPPTPRMPAGPLNAPIFDEPFGAGTLDLARMQRDLDQLFGDFNNLQRFAAPDAQPALAMRVEERGIHYVVTLKTGAAQLDSLEVGVVGNHLTVSGIRLRMQEQSKPGGAVSRQQSKHEFIQSFPLPGPVKEHEIQSDFKDGVWTITLPKATASLSPQRSRRNIA